MASEDAATVLEPLNKQLTFFLIPETIDESFFDLEGLSGLTSSLGMGLSSLLVRSITEGAATVLSAAFLMPFLPLLTTFKGVLLSVFVVSECAYVVVDINFAANSDW